MQIPADASLLTSKDLMDARLNVLSRWTLTLKLGLAECSIVTYMSVTSRRRARYEYSTSASMAATLSCNHICKEGGGVKTKGKGFILVYFCV